MVRITEELVRKKSEHNECIINSLEELSLHQEDVEKIEHLQNWCRNLQILYLQSNLISKLENLNKLKKLEYLNLAVNNIETIENLQRCESLEKLDLTLNFVGDLRSVGTLKDNANLKHLYLTGNPCTDYDGYRDYVIARLPQLQTLDNVEITRSERIMALQKFDELERKIKLQEDEYKVKRAEQRRRLTDESLWNMDDETFWKSTSEHAPETRVEIAKRHRRARGNVEEPKKSVAKQSFFAKDGRPLNVNHAKLEFKFYDDEPEEYVLELYLYKYLDTTLVEVDVQPIYVKVAVKGKIFQFVLPDEVYTDRSVAQRSQTTGHLLIRMPRINYVPRLKSKKNNDVVKEKAPKREFLDVNEDDSMDFSKICDNKSHVAYRRHEDLPPPLELA